MMAQRYLAISPADIDALVVTCGHCAGEITIPLAGSNRFPPKCGQCDTVWFTSDAAMQVLDVQMLELLRRFRQTGPSQERAIAFRTQLPDHQG